MSTDQKAVAATTLVWKNTVVLGTDDTPKKTAALYAEDAVLWGTVSEEVRETPEQIYDYFVSATDSRYFFRGGHGTAIRDRWSSAVRSTEIYGRVTPHEWQMSCRVGDSEIAEPATYDVFDTRLGRNEKPIFFSAFSRAPTLS